MSDDPSVLEWVKKDAFTKAGITAAVDKHETPSSLVELRVQHRMDERICAVVNEIFYQNRLETAPSIATRPQKPFPYGSSALFFVDTGSEHPWTSQKLGTYSRYNVLHALLICNLARRLKTEEYLDPEDNTNQSLGVVSPYAAQTRLIERVLQEHLKRPRTQFALTVHRFQGNEKNSMIVDLTDSLGARPSKFIRARSIDEDGARLLNVALSRARDHVVLIANFGYLREKLSSDSVVLHVLDLFERTGDRIDVKDLVEFAPEDWARALDPLTAPTINFDPSISCAFTEATFYPAFARDVQDAVDSVVIFSPFLTARGSARWADLLRLKVGQGVRVRLVVRPSGDQGLGVLDRGLQELIDELVAMGIIVDLRASMHEKFAIIDGKVLWHGSLNILSHRDTSESMLRISSPSGCEEMARFVVAPQRGLQRDQVSVDVTAKENPDCPEGAHATVLRNGRFGIYFECSEKCGGKIDPRRGTRSASTRKAQPARRRGMAEAPTSKACPRCGGGLVTRRGRFGEFWGCTDYPRCRYTASGHQSNKSPGKSTEMTM